CAGGVPCLGGRAIVVVRGDVNDQSPPPRTIALKSDFLVKRARKFAGAALDGPFDVVGGHVLRLGGSNRRAQPRVAVHVASAGLRRYRYFLDQARENLAAFRVERPFFVLYCGPF